MSNTFPKTSRLVRSADISEVMKRGECVADGVLVLFARHGNRTSLTRLGVTIPKKAGCAVVRNRWKRLIREAFRTQQGRIPLGLDLVVRPKKDAQPAWELIERGLPRLVHRAAKKLAPRGDSAAGLGCERD